MSVTCFEAKWIQKTHPVLHRIDAMGVGIDNLKKLPDPPPPKEEEPAAEAGAAEDAASGEEKTG